MLLRARLAQSTDKHLVYIVESYLQIIAEEALYLVYWQSDESFISFVGMEVPYKRAFLLPTTKWL